MTWRELIEDIKNNIPEENLDKMAVFSSISNQCICEICTVTVINNYEWDWIEGMPEQKDQMIPTSFSLID